MLQRVLSEGMGKDIASMLGGSKIAKPGSSVRKVSKNANLAAQSFPARWKVEGSHCITNFPSKNDFAKYVREDLGQDTKKLKLACFDLDGTLVNTKSGSSFARGLDDWTWFSANARERVIKEVEQKKAVFVIFTNQGGVVATKNSPPSKSYQNLKERINQVVASLGKSVPYPLVVAAPKRPKGKQKIVSSEEEHSLMRKPSIGMWQRVERYFVEALGEESAIDKEESFYVGDAAGRDGDFLDSDKLLASNVGVKFLTPEEFFGS